MDFRRVQRIIRTGRLMALGSLNNPSATITCCRLSLNTTSSEWTRLEIARWHGTDIRIYGYGASGPRNPPDR
jgi:hypothetical protein